LIIYMKTIYFRTKENKNLKIYAWQEIWLFQR
jgi:hypothetical protein